MHAQLSSLLKLSLRTTSHLEMLFQLQLKVNIQQIHIGKHLVYQWPTCHPQTCCRSHTAFRCIHRTTFWTVLRDPTVLRERNPTHYSTSTPDHCRSRQQVCSHSLPQFSQAYSSDHYLNLWPHRMTEGRDLSSPLHRFGARGRRLLRGLRHDKLQIGRLLAGPHAGGENPTVKRINTYKLAVSCELLHLTCVSTGNKHIARRVDRQRVRLIIDGPLRSGVLIDGPLRCGVLVFHSVHNIVHVICDVNALISLARYHVVDAAKSVETGNSKNASNTVRLCVVDCYVRFKFELNKQLIVQRCKTENGFVFIHRVNQLHCSTSERID